MTSYALDRLVKDYAVVAGTGRAEIKMYMIRIRDINDLMHVRGYELPAIAERVRHKHISTTERYLIRRAGYFPASTRSTFPS